MPVWVCLVFFHTNVQNGSNAWLHHRNLVLNLHKNTRQCKRQTHFNTINRADKHTVWNNAHHFIILKSNAKNMPFNVKCIIPLKVQQASSLLQISLRRHRFFWTRTVKRGKPGVSLWIWTFSVWGIWMQCPQIAYTVLHAEAIGQLESGSFSSVRHLSYVTLSHHRAAVIK